LFLKGPKEEQKQTKAATYFSLSLSLSLLVRLDKQLLDIVKDKRHRVGRAAGVLQRVLGDGVKSSVEFLARDAESFDVFWNPNPRPELPDRVDDGLRGSVCVFFFRGVENSHRLGDVDEQRFRRRRFRGVEFLDSRQKQSIADAVREVERPAQLVGHCVDCSK